VILHWIVPVAAWMACLWAYSRYSRAAIRRDWEMVLTPKGQRALGALTHQVELDATLADSAYAAARHARRRAEIAEAGRLLELSFSIVEQATPDRLTRLRAMGVCCRMASAMMPLPPLRPRDFHLRQLTTVAGLVATIHHLVVTSTERFLLRLRFLAWGFHLTKRIMGQSVAQVKVTPRGERGWREFSVALADFKQLDAEHIASFRALMASLEAER